MPAVGAFHSFLIPSTQQLSAPLARVALSLHYTSQRTVIPQSACNTLPMGLYSNQKIQTLPKLLLHSFPTIVSFRSVATLAFADPDAKKHASPAVNGRRLPLSFFGLLQPPPLLRSQAARRNGFALVYLRSLSFRNQAYLRLIYLSICLNIKLFFLSLYLFK